MNKQMRDTLKTGHYTAILLGATLLAASAQAQERFWSATTGNWSDPANWGGDVPDTSAEFAIFPGVDGAANLDGSFSVGSLRSYWGAQGTVNEVSGAGTLTILGNGDNNFGIGNWAGGDGGQLSLNANIVINNTGGNQLTWMRNDNSSGNSIEFTPASTLTLVTPLAMTTSAGGTIAFNGTLSPSTGFLVVQNNNASFNAGHNSSAFGQDIAFWGSNRKLTVNGGTVLAPGRKFSIQGTGGELELNGANAINGANIEVLSTHNLLLDVNSSQLSMGAVSLGAGVLTIDVDAGVTDLFFADSSAQTWGGGTVAINGFQEGVIKFGSDSSGLTSGQLAAIDGGIYGLTGLGYLTVVPEPATLGLVLFGGVGLLAARRMRV